MKELFIVIAILIGVAGLSFGLKVLFFPVHTANNLIKTAYDVNDKTLNADNAIYNYEWFKQQKEDIDAMGKKINNSSIALDEFRKNVGERKNWTFEDKIEDSRLSTIKLGIKNQLEQAIADYNARAKMANRNIFQNSILPNYIDSLTFIKQ